MMRERAIVDSVRRRQQERTDSLRRALRLEAARSPAPRRSPMFGRPPFYGYTWVFYADILVGALIGLIVSLGQQRTSNVTVSGWRAVAGMIAGGIGGACVFIPFFFLAILASVLSFFGDGPSAIALFGWTLAVMVLTLLAVEVSRRRG